MTFDRRSRQEPTSDPNLGTFNPDGSWNPNKHRDIHFDRIDSIVQFRHRHPLSSPHELSLVIYANPLLSPMFNEETLAQWHSLNSPDDWFQAWSRLPSEEAVKRALPTNPTPSPNISWSQFKAQTGFQGPHPWIDATAPESSPQATTRPPEAQDTG